MRKMLYLFLASAIAVLFVVPAVPAASWQDGGSYMYTTGGACVGTSASPQRTLNVRDSVAKSNVFIGSNGAANLQKAVIYAGSGDDLRMGADGHTGDLVIERSGNIGLGTTDPEYALDVAEGDIGLDSGYGVKFENAAGEYKGSIGMTTDDLYITCFDGNIHLQTVPTVLGVAMSVQSTGAPPSVAIWSLASNGAVYSNNSVLTNSLPSSRDYKKDIKPIDLHAERVLKLEPKSYTWKNNGQKDFGYIAEELGEVIPELYQDDGRTKGYAAGKLEFFIIEVLKDQENRIDQLQSEISTLKARLDKE